MSIERHQGQILKLLTELMDLVKKLETRVEQPKVENHTHHHYPTNPTYHYPNWTYGVGGGGGFYNPTGGTTSTWSTNDPNTNPNNDPNPSGT